MPMPTLSDVAETRTRTMLEKIRETIKSGGMEPYVRIIEQETEGDLSTIDIAAALLKIQMEQGSEPDMEKREEMNFSDTGAEAGMVRFFLSVGRMHNVAPKDIVGAIAGETGIPGKAIGAIRILDSVLLC